ncbi:MAG: hypothetical protein GY953_21325 [bacterium]|nr:hypothetical protein [bacterium]
MTARENPFATALLDTIPYRLEGIGWEELIERLAGLNYRAAIVGPHGSGKTALLEALAERISGARLHRAPPAVLEPSEIVLLDSAERLTRLEWIAFRHRARHARGLVITAHRTHRLPTLIECHPTPALLQKIVADLLGSRPDVDIETLFHTHHGNLRNALLGLYEHFAAL